MPDTIAAIATANALSAVGIIRLSGDRAVDVAESVFLPHSGKKLSEYKPGQMVHGALFDRDNRQIDDCLCFYSKAPKSYTGEDTAELHCHGSQVVLTEAMLALFKAGARQALAGEYTKRAFLNGRMDLSQAEAVIDLISAETAEAAHNAAGQLAGEMSKRIDSVYDKLVDIKAHFHAVLDYPDEEIEDFEFENFVKVLYFARNELEELLKSAERGRILKSGVSCAIIGRPNAGKSSLLNALVGFDRAIVTPIAGTTRDTITESVRLGGVLLSLIDTAGIRQSDDPIEKIGVDRTFQAAGQAELALVVFDGGETLEDEDMKAIDAALSAKEAIAVVNKSDLDMKIELEELKSRFQNICIVSAAEKSGLDELAGIVKSLYGEDDIRCDGAILTNARHVDAATRALESLGLAEEAITDGVTADAVMVDIEQAMQALGEITGRTISDDVTAKIFERFCVGK